FGRLLAGKEDIAAWRELGPDPMEGGLDGDALATALARGRRTIKEALMDQTMLAGIGNILATEALWHAKLDPRSRTDALTPKDVPNLVHGLRTAIARQLRSREKAAGG